MGLYELSRIYDECSGGLDRCLKLIRSRGVEVAKKKSQRDASHSRLFSYNHLDRIAVIVEISCENDFALRGEVIQELGDETCFQVVGTSAETVELLFQQPYVRKPEILFEEVVNLAQMKINERVVISRFVRIGIGEE